MAFSDEFVTTEDSVEEALVAAEEALVAAEEALVAAAEAVDASAVASEDAVGPIIIRPTSFVSGAQPARFWPTHLDVVSKWRSSGQ